MNKSGRNIRTGGYICKFLVLLTKGFRYNLDSELQADIMKTGLARINTKTDFIVFNPEVKTERIDDEGRSVILPSEAKDKVYVKLDDFGSAEALTENCGFTVNTRYAVTFMLAEEY